jgi:membrane protein
VAQKKKPENKYWLKLKKLIRFINQDVWRIPLAELSPRKSFLIRQLRIFIIAFRGFSEDKIFLRAAGLTYYSLLGIIPVVGLAFGIAKGFGLESYVEQQLALMFSGREEIFMWIMSFTQSLLQMTSGGMIAGVGLVILLYTIMIVLSYIEDSFNDIWQIKSGRPWSRKFSDYFAMMFIAPLFLILSGTATVFLGTQVSEFTDSMFFFSVLSPVMLFLARLVPYLLIWIMFLIIYIVMPNTNVRFSSALIAAIIAGTMFQLAQWGYVYFQVGVSRYNAIYGSFAALPLLMFFMQISWLIVLFGAEISYANQNVEHYEFEAETQYISPYNKKLLSLYVLHLIIQYFVRGEKPLVSEEIADQLHIPHKLVRSILYDLAEVQLLTEAKTDHPKEVAFQPGMDINQISIRYVIEKLDQKGTDKLIAKESKELDILKDTLARFSELLEESKGNYLLKDLSPAKT